MKNVIRVAGAFILAAVFSQPCFAKFLDEDLSQFRSGSRGEVRSIASVEPADLQPSISTSTTSSDRGPALFELGLGVGGTMDPDYPGSDQSRVTVLPFPFGVYRGRILRSDRQGTRAKLFNGGGFDLSVSGTGSLPVHSDDNTARKGMEDLGWMAQIGPKIRFSAKDWADGSSLKLGLSGRAAVSALHFNDLSARGFVFQPEIVYQKSDVFIERLDFFSSLSATFATANYVDYLYGVRGGEASATRRAYEAHAGYIESELQAGFSFRTIDGRHKFVFNIQGGSLEAGANEDSPLVRTKLDMVVGLAWVWTIYESEEKAVGLD